MDGINVANWYRREDYDRIRQIMDDGSKMPETYDEWERNAKRQIEQAKAMGVNLTLCTIDPDEFVAFCEEKKYSARGSKERAMFGMTQDAKARGELD